MKLKSSNCIAIDLGSSKIAALVAHIDRNGQSKVLHQLLHYSSGLKSGVITDLKSAENSIIESIYELEQACGINISVANISLSGVGTKSYYVKRKMNLNGNKITKEDVQKIIQKSILEFKVAGQEIIHYCPIEFTVDGYAIEDPVGILGSEFGCQLHVITIQSHIIKNLANCFAKCQIEISSVTLASYASAISCLSEDELNLGSILIDIGARTTSFAVFLSDKFVYASHIPIGGWHITSDIAQVFSVSVQAAERLKILYGSCVISTFDREKMINIEDVEPDNLYNPNAMISSFELAQVINARMEEILNMVKEQSDLLQIHLASSRVVVTGGSSMLRGLKELTGQIFNQQVRIARPMIIPGFAEDYNPGMYSTSVGIVHKLALKQQKSTFYDHDYNNNWIKKVFSWLKENI